MSRADRIHHGTLAPILGPNTRFLIVGINPSLRSAAVQAPFAHPGNRFWPALASAGITPWLVDATTGLSEDDRAMLFKRGIGFTNLVDVATARADELTTAQLREGAHQLTADVARLRPDVVAMLGITSYRTAFRQPRAVLGRAPEPLAGAALWLLPNPSGLNAHETLDSLAAWYARAWADVRQIS